MYNIPTSNLSHFRENDKQYRPFTINNNYQSPSIAASVSIPSITNIRKKYCNFVSLSFKNILESKSDTTQTAEMIGAAIAPLPLIAYT